MLGLYRFDFLIVPNGCQRPYYFTIYHTDDEHAPASFLLAYSRSGLDVLVRGG